MRNPLMDLQVLGEVLRDVKHNVLWKLTAAEAEAVNASSLPANVWVEA